MPIVKLPRKRLLSMDRKSITVDIPDEKAKKKKKIDFEAIKRAKGIWKNKKIDGVEYQRKVRNEWN